MENGLWLSLMIGNSRLHWALLRRHEVVEAWDTNHLRKECTAGVSSLVGTGIPSSFISAKALDILRGDETNGIFETIGAGEHPAGDGSDVLVVADAKRFKVASVVPKELEAWLPRCPGISPISAGDAIEGVREYPTLGVDRALAVRGAARLRGWPVMVVDCGSAMTFTAGDGRGRLAGGAILPGVRLQLAALGTSTAQLPSGVLLPAELPPRWAMGTSSGIQAGVMWTIVAGIQSFIKDRWKIDPAATVVFTGGDGQVLHRAVLDSWDAKESDLAIIRERVIFVGDVIHRGIESLST